MTLPDWGIIVLTTLNVTAIIFQLWIQRRIKQTHAQRIELNRRIMEHLQEAKDRYGD